MKKVTIVPKKKVPVSDAIIMYFKRTGMLLKRHWLVYLLLAPLIIHLVLFSYLPMRGLTIAFQRFSPFLGLQNSPFVGLDNFRDIISGRASTMFWRAFGNTVILSLYGLAFGFPVPIAIAVMFHELKMGKFRNFAQSVLLLPNFLSTVIIAGIAIAFLQPTTGLINHFLITIGVIDQGIYFLTRPEYFRGIFTFIGIWGGAGFSSLIYLAALTGISSDLYESASLDGASRLRRIWHISLPGIRPTVVVLFILAIGGLMGTDFERALLLQQPVTFPTSDVLGTFVYRLGIVQNNFSIAAAAGLMNSVIALVLVVSANTISKKLSDTSLF